MSTKITGSFGEKLFHSIVPTYLLDTNYNFLEWNAAFDEVFAKPHKLKKGGPVGDFIAQFENEKELRARSVKVFSPSRLPLIDIEDFYIKSTKYGMMKYKKVAAQIWDEKKS
jgi:hypothetical protein